MKPTTGYDFITLPMIGIFFDICIFLCSNRYEKEPFFTHVTRFPNYPIKILLYLESLKKAILFSFSLSLFLSSFRRKHISAILPF